MMMKEIFKSKRLLECLVVENSDSDGQSADEPSTDTDSDSE
jgi:hypothetical protein